MQTNTFNMLLVWSKVFVLFVELFPSTGVLWVIGVRLHANCLHISNLHHQMLYFALKKPFKLVMQYYFNIFHTISENRNIS